MKVKIKRYFNNRKNVEITEDLLFEYGYLKHECGYINWNGLWVRKTTDGYESGLYNQESGDILKVAQPKQGDPFTDRTNVKYMFELEELQSRGFEKRNHQESRDSYKKENHKS